MPDRPRRPYATAHPVALSFVLLLAIGCGSRGTSRSTGTPAATTRRLTCHGAEGPREVSVRDACRVDADCAVGFHTIDCCGSAIAVGIRHDDRARFESDEAPCRASAVCECLAAPTRADDGHTGDAPDRFAAQCVAGRCVSYVAETTAAGREERPEGSRAASRDPTRDRRRRADCPSRSAHLGRYAIVPTSSCVSKPSRFAIR